eukprot:6046748-Pyramimonas_sp.AAC.3
MGSFEWRNAVGEDMARWFLARLLPCRGVEVKQMISLFNTGSTYYKTLKETQCRPVSLLVMNFGLHYLATRYNPSYQLEQVSTGLEGFSECPQGTFEITSRYSNISLLFTHLQIMNSVHRKTFET